MKVVFTILVLLSVSSIHISAQTTDIDSVAFKIVKTHLDKISIYLKENPESSNKLSSNFYYEKSVKFLANLTGILSESSGNFGGRFPPTSNDLKRWKSWLYVYETFIKWDAQSNAIKIDRIVEVVD